MRLSILAASTALLLCSSVAMAETDNKATQPNADPSNNAPLTADQNAATTTPKKSVHRQVRGMLQKAGFTDIHIMTGSLLIRAKDKDGNPVVMNLSPELGSRSCGRRVDVGFR